MQSAAVGWILDPKQSKTKNIAVKDSWGTVGSQISIIL